MDFVLPRAGIKLRQAFGRLIRSEEEVGAMFILDGRITKKSYGKILLKGFPKELPVFKGSLESCCDELRKFLV
jgi:ATP-dependent DNA helicase DinG